MKLNASSCIHCICMYMSLCMYCTFSGECGGTACHSVKNSSLFFKVHPLRKGGREREGGEKERDKEREGQMKDTFQPPHTHTHTTHLHHLKCPLVEMSDLRVHCVSPTLKSSYNVLWITLHHRLG